MQREKVNIEEIRRSAELIIIRLGLGAYTIGGPRDNVLEVESLPAWATVVSELSGEGYEMVTPGDYAASCGLSDEAVAGEIDREGRLFALVYSGGECPLLAVPLPEKSVRDDLGPHLA
jgi:hypothetical protein